MYSKEELKKRRAKLSKEKQELIRQRVQGEMAPVQATIEGVPKRPPSEAIPLSFAQQRVWFLQQVAPDSPAYNEPNAIYLRGCLNVDALERSLADIIKRHDVLRTVFSVVDGEPAQTIRSDVAWQLDMLDLAELPPDKQDIELRREISAESQKPFPLSAEDIPWRIKAIRLHEREYVLVFVMHHIIWDGWSFGILLQEFAQLYKAYCQGTPSPLPPLPRQYADFAVWQRSSLHGEEIDRQLTYWRQQLAGLSPLILPTDYARPAAHRFNGACHTEHVPEKVRTALQHLSQRRNATLFMTVLAAFNMLLARYSGQHDFGVGVAMANRKYPELESLIGFFINTLVIRANLDGNLNFEAYLDRVRQTVLDGIAHQDVPFDELVATLQPERQSGRNPLFQVSFVFQNYPKSEIALTDLTIAPAELTLTTSKFDLTLVVEDRGDGMELRFEYDSDLFETATIQRFSTHFCLLLQGVAADPTRPIAEFPLLTESERQQMLVDWNDTYTPYPEDMCLHHLFERQVAKTPEAVAVIFEDQTLSYRQLNERANQVAHTLIARGVGPDVLVGICVERSLELVVAVYGVLKAGGAYVPLDPAYPSQRLSFMLEDAGISTLLTQERVLNELSFLNTPDTSQNAPVMLCLDRDWPQIEAASTTNPHQEMCSDNLAYVIYTSGSTGPPKGVMISHKAIHNHLDWMETEFHFSAADIFLQKTPFSFDASV